MFKIPQIIWQFSSLLQYLHEIQGEARALAQSGTAYGYKAKGQKCVQNETGTEVESSVSIARQRTDNQVYHSWTTLHLYQAKDIKIKHDLLRFTDRLRTRLTGVRFQPAWPDWI